MASGGRDLLKAAFIYCWSGCLISGVWFGTGPEGGGGAKGRL